MAEAPLQQIIAEIDTLPTLYQLYSRISRMIEDPRVSVNEVSELVAMDQVMTAKLLKLVNSAFFGFPSQITTVSRAVMILGFQTLKNLIVSTSVMHLFQAVDTDPRIFRPDLLWEHSVACAVGARIIAQRLHYPNTEEMFVAGLLHDIGKIVLAHVLPQKFQVAVLLALRDKRPLYETEQQVIGLHHGEAGRVLAEAWRFPPFLVMALSTHHQAPAEGLQGLGAAVVHLSDILARALQLGHGGDPQVPPLEPRAWDRMGLAVKDLEPILRAIEQQYPEVSKILGGKPES
jgi:putative nucleotidyltransferase with HDIG domain